MGPFSSQILRFWGSGCDVMVTAPQICQCPPWFYQGGPHNIGGHLYTPVLLSEKLCTLNLTLFICEMGIIQVLQ